MENPPVGSAVRRRFVGAPPYEIFGMWHLCLDFVLCCLNVGFDASQVRESPGNLARFVENKKTESCFESFVIVHNVAKRHNLGTIARSATAFGVSELILVGRKDFNAFGSHGASLHVQFRHFHTLPEAALYLKVWALSQCPGPDRLVSAVSAVIELLQTSCCNCEGLSLKV